MANDKLGRPTDQRMALLRNQVSNFLWNEKLETTFVKAKAVQAKAEKLITLAVNTHEDTVKVVKTVKDDKGVSVKKEFINDGPKKLAARRKLMAFLYDLQEQKLPKESKAAFKGRTEDVKHPLIEKMFNVYGPRYAARAKEVGQGGGYTRIYKLDVRRGDATQMAKLELI